MATSQAAHESGQSVIGLSMRLYALGLLLTLAAVITLAFMADRAHRREVETHLLNGLQLRVNASANRLSNAVAALRADTLFLSRTPPVRGIIRARAHAGLDAVGSSTELAWQNRLAEIFTAFLTSRPDYYQVRYVEVGGTGGELLRVSRENSPGGPVSLARLRQSGGWDPALPGAALGEGVVGLSEFRLQREPDGFRLPWRRTLSAVTPVHDESGRVAGLIVVNMDVGPLFAAFSDSAGDDTWYAVDELGHYLAHEEAAVAFSHEVGNAGRLQGDFPVLAPLLAEPSPPGERFGRYRLPSGDALVVSERIAYDPLDKKRFVLLLATLPESRLTANIDEYRGQLAFGVVLALIILLPTIILVMRWLMVPLENLTRAARHFSRGLYDVALPPGGHGEVGALVQAFEHMRGQIAEREAALRAHNAELAFKVEKGDFDLRLAGSVVDNTSEGVMVTDARARILSVNPAFTEITGYSAGEAIGNTPRLFRSDHHDAEFYTAIWDELLGVGRWQGEIWNRRKSGEVFLEWLTINRVPGQRVEEDRYIAVFSDVTEERSKDERLHRLAFHDPLTGLPNRALAQDRLQRAIEVARRNRRRVSVMLIDLDRFKAINDGLGHDVGDLLIKKLAERLHAALRQSDTLARMGGDEFMLILEDADELETQAGIAEDILSLVAQPFDIHEQSIQVGASVGIAYYPDDGEDVPSLLKHADVAMYAAKADGRGIFRFFRTDMTERATRYLALEMELRHAIAHGELELHYQPKIVLADGRLRGVEALVRWRHPERGLVSPGEFIPVAEESGLIAELGDWVLNEACRQASIWQGRLGVIAVNVSARQTEKLDLVERIGELCEVHGIMPSSLQIELTESAVMKHPDATSELLARLRDLGATVAVDDFGTGYSSLSYLRRLPIDILKIDRSFILNLGSNEEDTQIARTVVALARALRLKVVAEGVETFAQAALLDEMGCDMAQGFLYSPARPAADLEDWMESYLARRDA